MPDFDLVVVGCGGGPDETNLSGFLLKTATSSWEDGIIALEAGSGQGALRQILFTSPNIFAPQNSGATIKPVKKHTAADIYSFIRCYLITHAHLDHVNSLVMSAGSLKGPRKRIFAARQTLEDLESVFSDRIWPNLASWNEEDEDYKLLYTSLSADTKYRKIDGDISARMLPLNHGTNATGIYESHAYFVRNDLSSQEFIFFGDVEPDSLASSPQTINVWRAAAPKIPNKLSVIFIECSWPKGRPDDMLFGHLSPEHVVAELLVLAKEVVKARFGSVGNGEIEREKNSISESVRLPLRKRQKKNPTNTETLRGSLTGLRVYITHCKDDMDDAFERPIQLVILDQIKALAEPHALGVEISAVEQGTRIEI